MLNLAEGIERCGHAVDLVLAQVEGPYLSQVSNAVRIVDLGEGKLRGRSRTLSRLPALVRYLRRERPDAMVSALSRANLVAVWARRLAGSSTRLVVNVQNNVSHNAPSAPTLLGRQAPRLARYFYRWADAVVGVSAGVADDLVQNVGLPDRLVRVVYNPSITPELRQKMRVPLDDPWFEPGEPPVVLAVGRLMKQKDFPTLLNAFSHLRRRRQARLLVLGEGSERRKLESQVAELGLEEDVRFPGFVENPYPYMASSSVFVLSSLWEGLPTVLTEALYAGPPIVSTDCPSGPREILKDGEFGLLVPMRDPLALAEAMTTALEGNAPRSTQESWQPYTIEAVVEDYLRLFFADE